MNLNAKYSFVIDEGVDCFYEAYDKGDEDCLCDFLNTKGKA